jgi:hypothetical protein
MPGGYSFLDSASDQSLLFETATIATKIIIRVTLLTDTHLTYETTVEILEYFIKPKFTETLH